MRAAYPLIAFTLGVLGFAVLELAVFLSGGFYWFDLSVLLEGMAYGLATLILALVFRPFFARLSVWWLLLLVPLFLVLYAPLAGLLGGLLRLTFQGGWGRSDYVIMTLFYEPINLLWDRIVTFPLLALPLGVVIIVILWQFAHRAATLKSRSPAH